MRVIWHSGIADANRHGRYGNHWSTRRSIEPWLTCFLPWLTAPATLNFPSITGNLPWLTEASLKPRNDWRRYGFSRK